jgi:hypothetical protein
MMLPDAVGPVALDLYADSHEWATGVRLHERGGQLWLVWHGGHEHVCRVTSPPVVDGDHLLIDTAEHRHVMLRAFGPSDTWLVFPANCSAWESYRLGLR